MQEALQLVRRAFGADALILGAREVQVRRWLRYQQLVEVMASPGSGPFAEGRDGVGGARSAALRTSPQQASGLVDRRDRLLHLDTGIDLNSLPAAAVDGTAGSGAHQQAVHAAPADFPVRDLLADQLETIEELLQQFGERQAGHQLGKIPPELFHLYSLLIEADVLDRYARAIVLDLIAETGPEVLSDPREAQLQLADFIESQFVCSGPIAVTPGQHKTVALVGPTGVGKTTTIAKLAANFRLRDGIRLGLVTVDTYRVAAVEQLRTYADIIDLPMLVVTSPLEMRRAIDELADVDLVLIDTAGRSPREELQLQELKVLLSEARVDEVHLVLSLTSNANVLEMAARKFAGVGVTSVVLTKLDEAAGMGSLLTAARAVQHPISYLATGQDVPDDIELADPARARRLILGQKEAHWKRL
jgi:flagellar biosynthesis protein FlhF